MQHGKHVGWPCLPSGCSQAVHHLLPPSGCPPQLHLYESLGWWRAGAELRKASAGTSRRGLQRWQSVAAAACCFTPPGLPACPARRLLHGCVFMLLS